MIARGKNASDLFPAVVKNVACKNIEVSATREESPSSTSRNKPELVGDEKGDSPIPGPGKDPSQMSLNQTWISMMGPGYPGCFPCGPQPLGVRTSLRTGAQSLLRNPLFPR